jgi:hypothetical protein
MVGFAPDPEQRLALDVLFAVDEFNAPAAFELALICSRQNLKTGLFKLAALGWLFLTRQRLVVWSAHEFRTAQEAFRDMVELIEGCEYTARQVRHVHRASGAEAIELDTGQRLIFKARTKGGGRGLTGDKVVLDEAFALQPMHMGALLPTLSAVPEPQVVYGSSAGLAESDVLRAIRDRGRAGSDPSLAYLEWCAPPGGCETGDCTHGLDADGCALDNEANWQLANPALGRRITVEHIRAERRAMPPAEFARERLGWWDEPDQEGSALSFEAWQSLADDTAVAEWSAFGIEVSLDRDWTSIGAAGPVDDDRVLVDLVERRRGTGWVVPYCVNRGRAPTQPVFIVDGGGPAAGLIPELEAAGLWVVAAGTRDVAAACAGMVDAVAQGIVTHLSRPELDQAVVAAKKRPLGDGAFAFGRKISTADITPLVAPTLALWGYVTYGGGLAPDDVYVGSF